MTRHLFVESKTTLSTNRNILNQSEKFGQLYFVFKNSKFVFY